MTEYIIENIWQKEAPETKGEVIKFWRSEGVKFSDEEAAERAKQLVMVGRDSDGKIAGVCTAIIKYYPILINHLYYYRSFISSEQRHQGLAIDLIKRSREYFNSLFQEGIETKAIGIFLEIENELLKKRSKAVWESGDNWNFYFIGVDQNGSHLRVSYFENTFIL